MTLQPVTPITAEHFDNWAELPENAERRLELIGGGILEVVSAARTSQIAMKLGLYLGMYLLQNPIGHITGADGGFQVLTDRYIPDVGYISKQKIAELPFQSYLPFAPDLAIEVISPTDTDRHISIKVGNYLAAQTVVWVVYPETEEVVVYVPGQAVKIMGKDGTLEGGTVLPNFTLTVKAIFEA
jgi:Uma2 family endonuclease